MDSDVNAIIAGKNRTCILKLTQLFCFGRNINANVHYKIRNDMKIK